MVRRRLEPRRVLSNPLVSATVEMAIGDDRSDRLERLLRCGAVRSFRANAFEVDGLDFGGRSAHERCRMAGSKDCPELVLRDDLCRQRLVGTGDGHPQVVASGSVPELRKNPGRKLRMARSAAL